MSGTWVVTSSNGGPNEPDEIDDTGAQARARAEELVKAKRMRFATYYWLTTEGAA